MTSSVPLSAREERRKLLEQVLATELADAGVGALRAMAGGLESVVLAADSREWGPVVIKLPLARVLRTGNEMHLDTRDLLAQELTIADLIGESGIPCPVPHVLYTNDDSVDFLVVHGGRVLPVRRTRRLDRTVPSDLCAPAPPGL